jgi:glutathione S-transferase
MIKLAQLLYDFPSLASSTHMPQFITISYSHYVEFARWSLELTGAPFQEHGFAPGQHALAALSVRVASSGQRHFATSSSFNGPKASPTSMPLLVLPDGSVLKDSWEISASCSALAPMEEATRELLDKELGTAARALVYTFLLQPQHSAAFTAMCTEGRHWAWRLGWHLGLGFLLRSSLRAKFPAARAAEYAQQVEQLMSGKLAELLEARQGRYLGGASPGQADLALASFVALLTLPEQYGGRSGSMPAFFGGLLAKDEQLRASVEKFRATKVGAYCMQLYKEHRLGSSSRGAAFQD